MFRFKMHQQILRKLTYFKEVFVAIEFFRERIKTISCDYRLVVFKSIKLFCFLIGMKNSKKNTIFVEMAFHFFKNRQLFYTQYKLNYYLLR